MRTLPRIALLLTAAFCLLSCSGSGKRIPDKDLRSIYREMLLADQWIEQHPQERTKADTSLFYEPILRKYGYTMEDYHKAVLSRLSDPKRFGKLIGRLQKDVSKEKNYVIELSLEEKAAREKQDSMKRVLRSYRPDRIKLYSDYFARPCVTDSIHIEADENGLYVLIPIMTDTLYSGPKLITNSLGKKKTAPKIAIDTVDVVGGALDIEGMEIETDGAGFSKERI